MTPVPAPGLYDGTVFHKRLGPRRHVLRYRLFWTLLDCDDPGAGLRLLSHNRFNVFALHDRDHLAGDARPLRAQIEAHLAAAGFAVDGGPIRLLCMPRILGHAFNPISLFFCYRRDGALAAVLYEVNNTFGQRHCYLAAVEGPGPIRQQAAKAFYVSPFMDMGLSYDFDIDPPADAVSVTVNVRNADALVLTTNFTGQRRPLTDGAILGAVLRHPLMTFKVVVGIHWEALRLWRKGVRFRARPAPPEAPVTLGRPR